MFGWVQVTGFCWIGCASGEIDQPFPIVCVITAAAHKLKFVAAWKSEMKLQVESSVTHAMNCAKFYQIDWNLAQNDSTSVLVMEEWWCVFERAAIFAARKRFDALAAIHAQIANEEGENVITGENYFGSDPIQVITSVWKVQCQIILPIWQGEIFHRRRMIQHHLHQSIRCSTTQIRLTPGHHQFPAR